MNKAYIDMITPCMVLAFFLFVAGVILSIFSDSVEQFKLAKTMIYLSVGIMVVMTFACLVIGVVMK